MSLRTRSLLAVAMLCLPVSLAAQGMPFRAIWGASADDAWIVGAGPSAMHWNGTAWSPVDLPEHQVGGRAQSAALNAIWGLGADDVWAVGDRGRVLRWQGSAWEAVCVAVPAGGACLTPSFMAVAGFGPNDVYVASQSTAADQPAQLYHWNGTEWSVLSLPMPFRVAPGGLAAYGSELVLVGSLNADPHPSECPPHPLMGGDWGQPCVKSAGVIARLNGQQWTITVSADAVAGGIYWAGLAQSGSSLLAFGTGLGVENRRSTIVSSLVTSTYPATARARRAGGGFETWSDVPAPPMERGGRLGQSLLFPRGEIFAIVSNGFARRRLGRWTATAASDSREAGTVNGNDFGGARALWGASPADIWVISYQKVFRVQGTQSTMAFDGSCAGLGARAAGTPNCLLYGAAEPQRTSIPTPSRFPKPRP